jgi:hypothetical protein
MWDRSKCTKQQQQQQQQQQQHLPTVESEAKSSATS